MDARTILGMPGVTLGVGAGVMLAAMAILWKVEQRDRWMLAAGAVALAAGFVSGYAMVMEFPRAWTDPSWKFAVVTASVAGVMLLAAHALPQRLAWVGLRWAILAGLIATVTWLTVRRFNEHQATYALALVGSLVLYFFALGPSTREPRAWAIGPLVLLLTAMAATAVGVLWVDVARMGRMLMMMTALAGLTLVAGVVPRLRPAARGGAAFLAVMIAVLLLLVTYYNQSTIPWWGFAWIGVGPLAAAVAWSPRFRARPWLGAAITLLLALAILVPAVVVVVKYAPPPFD